MTPRASTILGVAKIGKAPASGRGARRVFHPDLGAFFASLRKDRGWSVEQSAILARHAGFDRVTHQRLRYLEEGRLKHPEPDLLAGVASIYGCDYTDLVMRFVRANYSVPTEDAATPTPPVTAALSPLMAQVTSALEQMDEKYQTWVLELALLQGSAPADARVAELARVPLQAVHTTSRRGPRRKSPADRSGGSET